MSRQRSFVAAVLLSATFATTAIAEIAPPEMPEFGPLASEGDLKRASGLLDAYRSAADRYVDQARQAIRTEADPAAHASLAARLNRIEYARRDAELRLAAAARAVRSGRPTAPQVADLVP